MLLIISSNHPGYLQIKIYNQRRIDNQTQNAGDVFTSGGAAQII